MHMSKELVDYSFVAMTYTKEPRRQVNLMIRYEWNDKRWVKLKCKTNWTNIILLVHVVVISVQVGLLYEFFIAII
jgi:hypothetical protein